MRAFSLFILILFYNSSNAQVQPVSSSAKQIVSLQLRDISFLEKSGSAVTSPAASKENEIIKVRSGGKWLSDINRIDLRPSNEAASNENNASYIQTDNDLDDQKLTVYTVSKV